MSIVLLIVFIVFAALVVGMILGAGYIAYQMFKDW